jgi:nicotinamidase-related amidase
MPVDLRQLAAPEHTAVLTMEMQRGVIGDLAAMPSIAQAVAAQDIVAPTARLLAAARAAGVRVVHCTAQFREDRLGSAGNSPMLAMAIKNPTIIAGTPGVELVPELDQQPGDLVSTRFHGLAPWAGTSLDVSLHNLGVSTVVATGFSINIGIFGMLLGAVDLGYRAVLATDCVGGIPEDYAQSLVDNSLALLATRATSGELIEIWSS